MNGISRFLLVIGVVMRGVRGECDIWCSASEKMERFWGNVDWVLA